MMVPLVSHGDESVTLPLSAHGGCHGCGRWCCCCYCRRRGCCCRGGRWMLMWLAGSC